MNYEDFKPGSYYLGNDIVFHCVLYKGLPLLCHDEQAYTIGDAILLLGSDYFSECDRDGNLLALKPAVGQIWETTCGTELVVVEYQAPDGDLRWGRMDNHGIMHRSQLKDDIDDTFDDLIYIANPSEREVDNEGEQ